jgi:hypothetical protein
MNYFFETLITLSVFKTLPIVLNTLQFSLGALQLYASHPTTSTTPTLNRAHNTID